MAVIERKEMKMYEIIQALLTLGLSDAQVHKAEGKSQVSAKLPSGEEIRVMKSKEGWHVGFGKSDYGTRPMSEEEAARKIYGA